MGPVWEPCDAGWNIQYRKYALVLLCGGWLRNSNGDILVPVDQTKEYVNFTRIMQFTEIE